MSFFRRLRREKEETPSEEPTEPAGDDEGTIWTDENRPVIENPPEAPPAEIKPAPAPVASPAPAPPAAAPAPASGPPPPLPRPAAAPTTPTAPSHAAPFSLCFVCGNPLEGKTCATCRMTWAE
ncbi:MAG TPA: hypothetical protein VK424_07785 [Thermoplasmata archaeon]|nr:hypothetical protein [Thermoplasmata archaeon]